MWCYTDYDRAIWPEPPLDRAPHERHFGLWRADGSAKPAVGALAEWSGRRRAAPRPPPWSESDRRAYQTAPRETLIRLYEAYAVAPPLARPVL